MNSIMITKKDTRWMNLAQKMSRASNHHRYLFCCLIVKGGRLISVGINKDQSAPKIYARPDRPNMNLHSEISACHNIDRRELKNATAYIGGISKTGGKILTKPCRMCYSWLQTMGIKRIVFIDKLGELQEV